MAAGGGRIPTKFGVMCIGPKEPNYRLSDREFHMIQIACINDREHGMDIGSIQVKCECGFPIIIDIVNRANQRSVAPPKHVCFNG